MRILHVFRAAAGGLFRHVRDLIRGQSERGHEVGLICSDAEDAHAARYLAEILPQCKLGIHRLPIARLPHLQDIAAIQKTAALSRQLQVEFLHGHGAKGGLLARAAADGTQVKSVYTPHGGSLHYSWSNPVAAVFLATEIYLARKTTGFIFVCDFERRSFEQRIGLASRPYRVIHNGLWPEEFHYALPQPEMSDLLFVGEMRMIKGVDLLLDALKLINQQRPTSLTLVGDGPDMKRFEKQAAQNGLAAQTRFVGRKSLAEALKLGRLMVIPSRAESFPYIVLETIAAQVPLLATQVGGIPEILPERLLIAPGKVEALVPALLAGLNQPEKLTADARAAYDNLQANFTAAQMVDAGIAFYQELGKPGH